MTSRGIQQQVDMTRRRHYKSSSRARSKQQPVDYEDDRIDGRLRTPRFTCFMHRQIGRTHTRPRLHKLISTPAACYIRSQVKQSRVDLRQAGRTGTADRVNCTKNSPRPYDTGHLACMQSSHCQSVRNAQRPTATLVWTRCVSDSDSSVQAGEDVRFYSLVFLRGVYSSWARPCPQSNASVHEKMPSLTHYIAVLNIFP